MGLSQHPDVSVVILTKNSARTLERCLESIIREKPKEILAVDGSSTDATLTILKNHNVRIIVEPSGSLGRSRQIGVEAAKGILVMFVDSDVELGPNCISIMRRELLEHEWAGIHARLLSSENVSYWQRAEDEKFRREYDHVGMTNKIDTDIALFRREVILEHPFDPSFRLSSEDADICRRLVAANYRLGVCSAIAYHHHRREFSTFVQQRYRYGLGRAWLGFKYGDTRTLVTPLLTAISQTIRAVRSGKLWLVPYWVVGGVIEFCAVVIGTSTRSHQGKKA